MKRSPAIAFLLIAIVISTTAACLLTGGTNATKHAPQTTTATPVAYAAESVTKKTASKAVEFTWKENGTSKSFSELTKGKVVLLNLWATWCGPCRRELPDLVELSKEMADKGVVVVGVSLDQGEKRLAVVKSFVEKNSITYLNVVDTEDSQIAEAYGNIQSIPTTFIIDRNGNVVQRITGMQSKIQFTTALQRAL